MQLSYMNTTSFPMCDTYIIILKSITNHKINSHTRGRLESRQVGVQEKAEGVSPPPREK